MAFVDELTLFAQAGRGGDGSVRWLHLKGKEYSGPAGGNGGNGGDVYVRGVRDLNLLSRYRSEKVFKAQDGEAGGNQEKTGKSGADLVVDLPVGSVVRNTKTGESVELVAEGQSVLVLKGGRGGVGNTAFKSSVNRSPEQSTPGGRGEEAQLQVELRLIADAGLVGLPNAGKTSLLNALAGTASKVGSYAFTTLDPNLGVLHGFVLADIPGVIEGASQGKGLGLKFLRHIARTRLLLHCVSLESETPLQDYRTVRAELEGFEGGVLSHKPEVVILTKSDTRGAAEAAEVSDLFAREGKRVFAVSVLDDASLKALVEALGPLLG